MQQQDPATRLARERPPDNELGVLADVTGILNRSDNVVLALLATRVYSRGVAFDLAALGRVPTPISLSAHGFGKPETGGGSVAPFLLAYEWSDGSFSSNMPLDNAHGLHHRGGGGNNRRSNQSLYLDHLPPPGPFKVVTAWPSFDLPEAQVRFDADVILTAAASIAPLWDHVDYARPSVRRTDEQRREQDKAAVLAIPRTGWFAEHFERTPLPLSDKQGQRNEIQEFSVTAEGTRTPLPLPTERMGWRLAD